MCLASPAERCKKPFTVCALLPVGFLNRKTGRRRPQSRLRKDSHKWGNPFGALCASEARFPALFVVRPRKERPGQEVEKRLVGFGGGGRGRRWREVRAYFPKQPLKIEPMRHSVSN